MKWLSKFHQLSPVIFWVDQITLQSCYKLALKLVVIPFFFNLLETLSTVLDVKGLIFQIKIFEEILLTIICTFIKCYLVLPKVSMVDWLLECIAIGSLAFCMHEINHSSNGCDINVVKNQLQELLIVKFQCDLRLLFQTPT